MTKDNNAEKRPYQKPEIRRVQLKPEESLVAGCKTTMSSAPYGSTCADNGCMDIGS